MDFKSLTYFVTVARELNITRAAAVLNMSQPPLSNQIRQLEEDIGAQLFIRSKRGLTLTPTGVILYKRARQILELYQTTREEVSQFEAHLNGDLKIGVVEGRAPFLLARWIAGFREEFPQVTYTVRSGGSDDILDQLFHHLIDIAVIAAPYNQELLHGISVSREPWVAIIPSEHPLALLPGSSIALSQLKDEPLIVPERSSRVESIKAWFGQKDITPNLLCRTSNYIDALSLVEQGVGISIFPQSTYTPNPHAITKLITDPAKAVEYVLVYPKAYGLSELPEAFRDYVNDFITENGVRSPRFKTPAAEFKLPPDTQLL